jgi:hypothetical protein
MAKDSTPARSLDRSMFGRCSRITIATGRGLLAIFTGAAEAVIPARRALRIARKSDAAGTLGPPVGTPQDPSLQQKRSAREHGPANERGLGDTLSLHKLADRTHIYMQLSYERTF